MMPVIRKSADLRNNYREISELCHTYREPVFITRGGEGDLAVMSIETYEELAGGAELRRLIQEGIDDVECGRVLTEKQVVESINALLGR
jgi:PHD/YefM family antitoxin component YafN of YafNO toxin-antitoxin module